MSAVAAQQLLLCSCKQGKVGSQDTQLELGSGGGGPPGKDAQVSAHRCQRCCEPPQWQACCHLL